MANRIRLAIRSSLASAALAAFAYNHPGWAACALLSIIILPLQDRPAA